MSWNKLLTSTGTFRGYDPHAENLAALRARCQAWVKSAADHPKSYSTKSWHKVEDQGQTPSCGGHALSNAMECVYRVASRGKVLELSRWFAWLESQRVDGGRLSPNRGISIQAAAEVAKAKGVCRESLCPFKGEDWDATISPEAYLDAADFKCNGQFWLTTYEETIDFLWSGAGAVVAGVPWEFNMRAWHAVCLSGWGEAGEIDGENSWGPDWDEDGHFQWSEADVRKFLKTPNVVFVGLSDMQRPGRRDWDWHKDFLA
jgi:hypothetical protein